jgi:hypothetical protein
MHSFLAHESAWSLPIGASLSSSQTRSMSRTLLLQTGLSLTQFPISSRALCSEAPALASVALNLEIKNRTAIFHPNNPNPAGRLPGSARSSSAGASPSSSRKQSRSGSPFLRTPAPRGTSGRCTWAGSTWISCCGTRNTRSKRRLRSSLCGSSGSIRRLRARRMGRGRGLSTSMIKGEIRLG